MTEKKKNMTREEAAELYRDLKKTMAGMKKKESSSSGGGIAKDIAQAIKRAMAKDDTSSSRPAPKSRPPVDSVSSMEDDGGGAEYRMNSLWGVGSEAPRGRQGTAAAYSFVLLFAGLKVVMSGLEASGFLSVQNAEASAVTSPRQIISGPSFSKEQIRTLTALDDRRRQLEERGKKLEEHELELDRRDREFALKLTELRDLTTQLRSSRENLDRKQHAQLDQLANVYGSMNPNEAAALMEQLDITIALSLLERMPEKRIGQILALMTAERALTITKMLSSGAATKGVE